MKILKFIFLITLITFSNNYTQDFWEQTAGPDTTTIWSLVINTDGDIFAGTSMDGVFRSTNNGASWTNLGISNYDIRSMAVSSNGDILLTTDPFGGIFRSTDNGNNWTNLGFTHYDKSIAINNSNGYIFIGTGAFGVGRTTDNGATWPYVNNGFTATMVPALIINSNGNIFAGTVTNSDSIGSGGVYRSTNNGDNWVQIKTGLSSLDVFSLAINLSGDIFAGTSGGGVFRSTNNGDNWVQISEGLTGDALYVYSLAINSNGDIFAGTAVGVFRSTDNGNNWVQINQGLTNTTVHSLAINSSGIVFAGTEGGIFRSLESSLPVELTSFNAKVNNNQVILNWETATEVDNYGFEIEREINSANNTEWEKIGFVQGNGNSNSPKNYSFVDRDLMGGSKFSYRLKQIDTDGNFEYSNVIEAEIIPTNFVLYQNYPNPFNPSTVIEFSLPEDLANVKLSIYNALGENVAELVSKSLVAGKYQYQWNAENVATGMYIYKLRTDKFVSVKKMILMK